MWKLVRAIHSWTGRELSFVGRSSRKSHRILDNVSIIEIGPTVHTFPYLFIVTRNEDSVFGYQVVSMSYGMR